MACGPAGHHQLDHLLVVYEGDEWLHERILLFQVSPTVWIICTPHFDLYEEDLAECASIYRWGPRGGVPHSWSGHTQHPHKIVRFNRDDLATRLPELQGRAAIAGAAAAPNASGSRDAQPGLGQLNHGNDSDVFVAVEARGGYAIGDPVAVNGGAFHRFGDRGILVTPAGPLAVGLAGTVDLPQSSSNDLRTLDVLYDNGARSRGFDSALASLTESAFTDWPVQGPRTLHWLCRTLGQQGSSFARRHHWWSSVLRLSPDDLGVDEHQSLCEVLQMALQYDQLNITQCGCFELLARRLQFWESYYAKRLLEAVTPQGNASSRIDGEERNLFMGQERTRSLP